MLSLARRIVFALAVLCGAAGALRAHDPGLSAARATVGAREVVLAVSFAPADVAAMLPPAARPTTWTAETFARARADVLALGDLLYAVRVGGRALAAVDSGVELTPGDRVTFSFRYARPAAAALEFEALNLGALPPAHREHFAAVDESGRLLVERMLQAGAAVVTVPMATPPPASVTESGPATAEKSRGAFGSFFVLGIEHIWTGYDHLLFLFGLLVVCGSLRSIAAIVSSFTVAHSLTLGAATLGWIAVPGRWVEPLIAASIMLVGVENLLRRGGEPRGRWAVTFAFGLIHGFGFAGVLHDLGVGRDGQGIVLPLVAFNLGVESGQLAIAAAVLPALLWLRRQPRWAVPAPTALSAVVVLFGGWWLLERTVLG
jgi:hypothetical protein